MGWDIGRFVEDVDDEFKCSICLNVLETPVHGPCGHVFCSSCINTWLESNSRTPSALITQRRRITVSGTCPVDRKPLCKDELGEAAIPFRNIISRLKIKCDFESFGCKAIITLGSIKDHVRTCNFNPEEVVQCPNGCSSMFLRRDLVIRPHNCIKELKRIIKKQEKKIYQLELHQVEQRRRWIRIYVIISVAAVAAVLMYSSSFDKLVKQVINNL